ncbi:hypothetical protein VTJ83DRAFT_6041 [Remersonia thermophila]|uniref:MARVEL domain-containing protein n=1 Tax=Remersonia thermophila TaxID=72144 RepID=A0ABR4D9I4_9PEZI
MSVQAPAVPDNLYFPPPPTAPLPKPKARFPLRTAHKKRPSLEVVTGFDAADPLTMRSAPKLSAMDVTFTAARAVQFASLIAVIGLCANFISIIATADHNPPAELVGTLTVSVMAVIYAVITYILYYDAMLPLLATSFFDCLLLIACVVVASLVGKPLPRLNCAALAGASPLDAATLRWTSSSPLQHSTILTKTISYPTFIALDKATCQEIKAVWGLSITLCILFAFSTLACIGLWHRFRREAEAPRAKDMKPWNSNDHKLPVAAVAPAAPSLTPPAPAVPRFSCDSDASSGSTVRDFGAGSPPMLQGLRPPPARHHSRDLTSRRAAAAQDEITVIAEEPAARGQGRDENGTSPLLSGAPPAVESCLSGPNPALGATTTLAWPRTRQLAALPQTRTQPNLASAATTLAAPHLSSLEFSVEKQTKRKPLPPPRLQIPTTTTTRCGKVEEAMVLASAGAASMAASIVVLSSASSSQPGTTPVPVSGKSVYLKAPEVHELGAGAGARAGVGVAGKGNKGAGGDTSGKRKTVWGLIDGWWDLGLLERMGTVRRKK